MRIQFTQKALLSVSLLVGLFGIPGTTVFAWNPTFFALNQSPATPPNVTGLDALEETTTSILLFWTSGGGTTANYRIAYQSGATAPASCILGTQIAEATVGAATNYTVTGLTANTQYSFRVCAVNAVSDKASGVTVTLRTPVSQPIFRSMAYNVTAAKAVGTTNAMSITGSIATFATALPTNIGVGDAIQYSSAGNATIDRIAFIHGRLSSTKFLVKTAAGAVPTAAPSFTSWSVFRAYINFNNAEAGTENTGIAAAVQNFDTWAGGADLVTLASTWYIECYADAPHAGTFTTITGWTTGANNKLIITTPWEARHVGATQRHSGTWNTSYFHATVTDNSILEINVSNVVVEGIQFQATATGASDWFGPIMIGVGTFIPPNSVVEVNSNIVVVVNTSAAFRDTAGIYAIGPNTGFKLYATNNIIICVGGAGAVGSKECAQGIRGTWGDNDAASWTGYAYNNTVVGDWNYGIDFYDSAAGIHTLYAKNNICQGIRYTCFEGGTGTQFAAGSGYNISHNGASTGMTGDKINTTVSFVAPASKNYHLNAADTAAKDAGTNLSADANYPVTNDIDTTPRTGTWDIGADGL